MLFIISGPTGSGKDTLLSGLLEAIDGSTKLPSTVTRAPRIGETGYRYVSQQEFKKKIENDEFVEYVQVFGSDYYGTLKSDLAKATQKQTAYFKILDVDGYLLFKQKQIPCVSIFITGGVDALALKNRIIKRGESQDDAEIRIARIDYEIEKSKEYDYVVSEKTIEGTFEKCLKIVLDYLKNC